MEPSRLILVPQLPVTLRYQEWWVREMVRQLKEVFDPIIVLGRQDSVNADEALFSHMDAAVENELLQIEQWLALKRTPQDVLLHCDLSYPGLFHSVLAVKKPAKSVVICHATSKNKGDLFEPIKSAKWLLERGAAALYDKVILATAYHARKLELPNARVLGALPYPPLYDLGVGRPNGNWSDRPRRFVSVARPMSQKVNIQVEEALSYISGDAIVRPLNVETWEDYYHFLDMSKFLIITSREETYGYQVVDAIMRGCVPIAPRAFSYPELMSDTLLYPNLGSPADRASAIMEIVLREETNPTRPLLKCDNKAKAFWTNLAKELKT